jgi:hypothetical protein
MFHVFEMEEEMIFVLRLVVVMDGLGGKKGVWLRIEVHGLDG